MATRRVYVGAGVGVASLTALLLFIAQDPALVLEVGPDSLCNGTLSNPCLGYFNVTAKQAVTFKQKGELRLEFDKPLESSYLCVNTTGKTKQPCPVGFSTTNFNLSFKKNEKKMFVIVGYKQKPEETVEWIINGQGPFFYGDVSQLYKELCRDEVVGQIPKYKTVKKSYFTSECSDLPANKTCTRKETFYDAEEFDHFENVVECVRYAFNLSGEVILEDNKGCVICQDNIVCYSKTDGWSPNRNPAWACECRVGESCFIRDLTTKNYESQTSDVGEFWK